MATFNKFENFVEDLGLGVHNLNTGLLKIYLSNTAPNGASHVVKADIAEISAGFGYLTGGKDTQNIYSRSGSTASCVGVDVVWTASGGTIGPFQYVILYNDTPTSPTDPLIGWWVYPTSITLLDGETFTTDFGSSMFTVAWA